MPSVRRYSGPLMRGQKSTRSKPKGYTKKKGGLNKTETKQVKSIANKVVNSKTESKYFNTNAAVNGEVCNAAWKISTQYSDVAVWAYSTGYNRQNNPGNENETMKYGVSTVDGSEISMTNLKLNKVFLNDDGPDEFLRAFTIVGQTIRPSYAECKWFLNLVGQNTDSDNNKGLMYRVRVIRVKPRAIKGSFQDIDPQNDLFLNQYDQQFGIATIETGGTESVFTREQFHLAKVNNRRYVVKEDKFFTIAPANTYHSAGDGQGTSSLAVGTISPGCMTRLTKHKIGKELFYPKAATDVSDDSSSYPEVGFSPEYIMYHAIALGDNGVASSSRGTPLGLTISCRPVSTFKDL